jgi:hypothetical protein
MILVETIPEIGGGEDKGEWWRGWIHLWYIWYIVRTSVNATMYPPPNTTIRSDENMGRPKLSIKDLTICVKKLRDIK